jgi:hypothetical protein
VWARGRRRSRRSLWGGLLDSCAAGGEGGSVCGTIVAGYGYFCGLRAAEEALEKIGHGEVTEGVNLEGL